jgi:hypothetical protein
MKNLQESRLAMGRTNLSFVSQRVTGAALALQQVERTAASITLLPRVGRFVVNGGPGVGASPFINERRPPVREQALLNLGFVASEGIHHD